MVDGGEGIADQIPAVEAESLLALIRPDELTEFSLGETTVTPCMLAPHLSVEDAAHLDDDVGWYDDPNERLAYERPDGVGARLVLINDVQWFPAEVYGREDRPVLISSMDRRPYVEMAEEWAKVSFSETASMMSGYSSWWLGPTCDPDVLVEVTQAEGEEASVCCWYSPAAQKVPSIDAWLGTISCGQISPDLSALAAQAVATGPGWTESSAMESALAHDGSDTGEWSLSLHVDGDEIEVLGG